MPKNNLVVLKKVSVNFFNVFEAFCQNVEIKLFWLLVKCSTDWKKRLEKIFKLRTT